MKLINGVRKALALHIGFNYAHVIQATPDTNSREDTAVH